MCKNKNCACKINKQKIAYNFNKERTHYINLVFRYSTAKDPLLQIFNKGKDPVEISRPWTLECWPLKEILPIQHTIHNNVWLNTFCVMAIIIMSFILQRSRRQLLFTATNYVMSSTLLFSNVNKNLMTRGRQWHQTQFDYL